MIFVTLGTQKFQFNRLLMLLDSLIDENMIHDTVFCQSGYTDYIPKNFKCQDFLNKAEFDEKICESNIVITHAGVGTIIKSLQKRKKVIVIPRLAEYGEHVDNHQIEIAEGFAKSGYVLICTDKESMKKCIDSINTFSIKEYESNNQRFVQCLKECIGI